MRLLILCLALAQAALIRAESRTAPIFIQPVTAPETSPSLVAEIQFEFDIADSTTNPEVTNYEAPEFPDDAKLVRVGVYDSAAAQWVSSTSVLSVDNFGKGYSPHFTVSVDALGNYLGASCKGVRIDAGQTRDFGPQAAVVSTTPGKQPDLNKPVVLSPEGKKVVPEEKTFLQKYWWVLAIGAFVLLSGGGGDQK